MSDISEDVRAVYRSFGHSDLPYHEVVEQVRYRQAQQHWPFLRLMTTRETTAMSTAGEQPATDAEKESKA
ncbi:hypothetical protein NCG89_15490 [Spongiibacter taiwanensis]|uniref:BcsR/BcsP family cellulose biosynthesis protein n=1 Tax=Spongiibacter taiwanensis TaxID=1748242 RepID=UPI00203648A2|nr:BcsR/BcsP family cellulose biosynthesis protein [Spongiibacter taiwanensis]USA42928.1 hypothetical protein NCG89_15490 [Spongiibacter taiwanensis]